MVQHRQDAISIITTHTYFHSSVLDVPEFTLSLTNVDDVTDTIIAFSLKDCSLSTHKKFRIKTDLLPHASVQYSVGLICIDILLIACIFCFQCSCSTFKFVSSRGVINQTCLQYCQSGHGTSGTLGLQAPSQSPHSRCTHSGVHCLRA